MTSIPCLVVFSGINSLRNKLVSLRVCFHVSPKRLSIVGVISSTIVLFTAIVNKWNSLTEDGEHNGILKSLMVAEVVQEPSIVVVVHKNTQSIHVLEVVLFIIQSVPDIVHGVATSEDISNGVVHGVVENSSQGSLVASYIVRVSIESFSHLEHS